MIIYFKLANFKSINNEVILNFNTASIGEHATSNVIDNGKKTLLKSILLYGHNASGKSKILQGLVFMRWFVIKSATERQANEEIDTEPFELLDSSSKKPSLFEVSFFIGKKRYRYGFEVDKERVHREWLLEARIKKEYPVFLRIGQDIEIDGKRFENAEGLEKRTRKNALFISVASQWNVEKAEQINEWFESIYTVHGLTDKKYRKFTIELLKNKKFTGLINSFIRKADLGINRVDIADIPIKLEDVITKVPEELKATFKEKFEDRSQTVIFTIHDKYNDKGEVIDKIPFLLDESESEGTKKYFNLIGLFVDAINNGKLVIIDEFDARLHTLLSKTILKLFNSEKIKKTAQLLVASHDTALLDRKLLRRDQIYFIEKDKIGATKVTSLVEFSVRKDTPYHRNYLEGRYGAIPFVGDLENLLADE